MYPFLTGHTDTESAFCNISAWAKGNHLTPEQWLDFMTETFNCPAMKGSDARLEHGVPVWRYRYFADWDNIKIFESSGAYHGVDLHMISGNSKGVSGIPESAPQTHLKWAMQKAWATFVENPEHGLIELGWPKYQKTGETCYGSVTYRT